MWPKWVWRPQAGLPAFDRRTRRYQPGSIGSTQRSSSIVKKTNLARRVTETAPQSMSLLAAEGVGFEPTRRCNPLRHFECRALDRTMRPLRGTQGHIDPTSRRERDLNPRGGANPQRHFQCRALDRTMRSLLARPAGHPSFSHRY